MSYRIWVSSLGYCRVRDDHDLFIVAGYRGASAYAAAFSREEDAGVTEDFGQAERCLLLVAATRAKRYLAVLQRS